MWKRISEDFTADQGYSLWGDHGISVYDISQGAIGNCWFIAAASGLAEVPERLEAVFVNKDDKETRGISPNGIYALNMYALLMPVTITIDDIVPFREVNPEKALYASIGRDHSVWGILIEKAFSKFLGSYETIVGGNVNFALEVLARSPGYYLKHAALSEKELWDLLVKEDKNHAMMSTGCPSEYMGLVSAHAYTVLKAVTLSNGVRLVQIRNPWGGGEYTGPWSDSSDMWTDKFKSEAGFTEENDGAFFMPIELYHTKCGETDFHYDVRHMWTDSFLKLND